jgi:hypothetical protein
VVAVAGFNLDATVAASGSAGLFARDCSRTPRCNPDAVKAPARETWLVRHSEAGPEFASSIIFYNTTT